LISILVINDEVINEWLNPDIDDGAEDKDEHGCRAKE